MNSTKRRAEENYKMLNVQTTPLFLSLHLMTDHPENDTIMDNETNTKLSSSTRLLAPPHQQPPFSAPVVVDAVATWSQYFFSWRFVELMICVTPLLLAIVLKVTVQPHQRPIPYQYLDSLGVYILNQEYNQVLDGDTVSSLVLAVVFGWLPCIVQLILAWFVPHAAATSKREKWDALHKTLCVYAAAFGTTIALTNGMKLYVGYLRPIFYDECQPNDTYDECQNLDGEQQVRLSFPSGHASESVCGMLLLSHYLERCFGAYRHCYDRGNKVPHRVVDAERSETVHGIEQGYTRETMATTYVLPSDQDFKLQRIVSLLCYAPMLAALFVGTCHGVRFDLVC
jgi:membrane-associated phospholipid phosphatase